MELRVQILPDLEAKRHEAEDNCCQCWRFYRITIMWVIDGKCRSLLVKTGDLAYMGESLIIVKANSILDVGRGP